MWKFGQKLFLGLFCTYFIVQGCTCAHVSMSKVKAGLNKIHVKGRDAVIVAVCYRRNN